MQIQELAPQEDPFLVQIIIKTNNHPQEVDFSEKHPLPLQQVEVFLVKHRITIKEEAYSEKALRKRLLQVGSLEDLR